MRPVAHLIAERLEHLLHEGALHAVGLVGEENAVPRDHALMPLGRLLMSNRHRGSALVAPIGAWPIGGAHPLVQNAAAAAAETLARPLHNTWTLRVNQSNHRFNVYTGKHTAGAHCAQGSPGAPC